MERGHRKYEELTIIDDFMFGKVMRHPGRCRKLLELILGVRIGEVVFLDDQDIMNPDYAARGIRLDIYLEDADNTVYNVEMQARNTGDLSERSRYYQSVIDINMIEKGAGYKGLKKSYIIFICTFDKFGRGRHIYHFENMCREDPAIKLNDGTEKIFLNTKGTMDDIEEDLRKLLEYFESMVPQDEYTRELEEAVAAAKEHKEWRREYMKLEVWEQCIRLEGETARLVSQICRKIKKGRTPEETAEDLEEDIEEVRRIYAVAMKHFPEYDPEKVLAELLNKTS